MLLTWVTMSVPAVAQLAFSDDGATLVAAGQDGSLTAIAVATGAPRELGKMTGSISALVAAPGRRAVVAGDVNGVLQLWPLDGGAPRDLTRHAGE